MCVEAGVSCCACECLVVLEGYVSPGLQIFVPLGEAEVNQVQYVLVFTGPYQEVVRLDVPVKEAMLVHELDSLELKYL